MKSDRISVRQMAVLCFLSVTALKGLYLPALLASDAMANSLISLMIVYLVELLTLLMICKYINNNPNKSFFELISMKIGKILTKILFFIIFCFYFIKLLILLGENYTFLRDSVFSKADLSLYLIIVLVVVNSISHKGITSYVRTCEFYYYFFLIGIIICVGLGFGAQDVKLPFINYEIPFFKIFQCSFSRLTWFGDFFFILMFMEKIDKKEHVTKKLFSFSLIAMSIIFIGYICYFSIYQQTAPTHSYALYELVVFAPRSESIGRLDLLPIMEIMLIIILQAGLFMRVMIKTGTDIFGKKHTTKIQIAINVLIIGFIYFIFTNNAKLFEFSSDYFVYISALVGIVIPLCLVFGIKRKHRGSYEKTF